MEGLRSSEGLFEIQNLREVKSMGNTRCLIVDSKCISCGRPDYLQATDAYRCSGSQVSGSVDSLFELVDCPECEGAGKVTVSREMSHDLESCRFCSGSGSVPAVIVAQEEHGHLLTRDIVEAAASIYGTKGLTHHQWQVVHEYERVVYDARRVQALMSQADDRA
jgi:RecJ-like exonuclease